MESSNKRATKVLEEIDSLLKKVWNKSMTFDEAIHVFEEMFGEEYKGFNVKLYFEYNHLDSPVFNPDMLVSIDLLKRGRTYGYLVYRVSKGGLVYHLTGLVPLNRCVRIK